MCEAESASVSAAAAHSRWHTEHMMPECCASADLMTTSKTLSSRNVEQPILTEYGGVGAG